MGCRPRPQFPDWRPSAAPSNTCAAWCHSWCTNHNKLVQKFIWIFPNFWKCDAGLQISAMPASQCCSNELKWVTFPCAYQYWVPLIFLMPNRIRQCWHDVHLGMGTVLSYCALLRLANGCIQPSVSIWFPTCGFLRVAHWPPSSAPAYSSPNGTSRAQWASWSTMVPHWPSTPELFLPWNFKQDKLPFDKSTRKYTYTCLYSHLQVYIVAEWNLEWGKITQK